MILFGLIVLIIFCIIASAFFSGSETAYVSVDKLSVDHAANKNVHGAKMAQKLLNDQTKLLSTTLVGNNLALILATSLATLVFNQFIYEEVDELTTTLVMAPILLIFAEVTPKSVARNNSLDYVLKTSSILNFIELLFAPINAIVMGITNFVLHLIGVKNIDNMLLITREEIKTMADINVEEGLIGLAEHKMINRVFELNKTTLSSVMKPLVDLKCFAHDTTIKSFLESMDPDFCLYPVFEERPDNIIGIIFINDVLKKISNPNLDLDSLTIQKLVNLKIPFIPENRIAATLLSEFHSEKVPILFAIDEYGGVSGMITIIDLAEEIMGDLSSGNDKSKPKFIVHGAGIDCDGRVDVDVLTEELGVKFDKVGYDTVAGLILKIAGRVPAPNSSFTYKKLKITVLKASRKRVERVRITQVN